MRDALPSIALACVLAVLTGTGGAGQVAHAQQGARPWADQGAIAVARASLEAAERAEAQAREQLRAERAAGRLSGRALEDFEAWIERLAAEVERQRLHLAWLEGQAAGVAAGAAPRSGEDPFRYGAAPTRAEQVAAMEATLDASLGEFDEMLLREQRLLSERPLRDESAGGGGGFEGEDGDQGSEGTSGASGSWAEGAGAERGAEQAAASAASAPGGQGEAEGREAAGAAGGEGAESAEASGETAVATATDAGQDRGRGTARGVPPDIPDGRDDDIVARQIREAAERETDPELQRKLWDEYRRYKNANR